jgi:pimeloyl-ACP methyl ester carboxylesterase
VADFLGATAKIVLAVAIGVPLLMYLLQDRLIFYPQPLSESRRAEIGRRFPQVRELFLESKDGVRLHAWHVPAIAGAPLVVYFGGNAEEVSWMIEDALARTPGIGWLLTSYRGYGGSGGVPSEAAISADALAWHDHAVKEFKPGKVFALGRSLGSGAAVYLAAERPLAGVLLAAPYDSLVKVARHHYPWLPVGLLLKHRFDSVSRAPGIKAPLVCLVAGRDEIIPPARARGLYDAWAGPKRWVALAEAGHNTTDSHPLFWQNVTEFLVKGPS